MPNIITGTSGNDTISGTADDDTIDAGAGNDIVNGSGGYDIVHGGDGDDLLSGGLHGELYGDAGNDRLIIYAADGSVTHPYTTADGGSGYDTAEVRFSNFGSGLIYTHDTNYAEIHCGRIAGVLVGIEAVIFNGSFADDQITGGPNADQIWGGLGNDMVAGGGGDDVVGGQGGDDRVFGNDGNDTLVLGTSGNDSFDGGAGIDTLNLSLDRSTASGVAVDLSLSSQVIEGRTITLTNIENLSGTAYADTLKGTVGDNVIFSYGGADVLTGNGGNDQFYDTAAAHNGDTITDFNTGDRIIVSDGNLALFSAALSGNTLTYTGGAMTLNGSFSGLQIVATAYAGGGVELSLVPHAADAKNDFNGDGRSDVLWRDSNGQVGDWLASASGGLTYNSAAGLTPVSADWKIAATGDFNGDGRSDILWRNSGTGEFGDWLSSANGSFSFNGAAGLTAVGLDWKIAGTGDFNGDGRDDILWRNNNTGQFGDWLGSSNGSFAYNAAAGITTVGLDWHIAGVGDFNGDGRQDVLWRNDNGQFGDWLANESGGFTYNSAAGIVAVGTEWKIAGTGDFNGDGRDDILWRNDSGALGDWLGTATGGFAVNPTLVQVPTSWRVAATGDYNGDGRDDILWRNSDGTLGDWLGTASGDFTINGGLYQVPTNWHVQPDMLV